MIQRYLPLILFICTMPLAAVEAGFELNSTAVFLEKHKHPVVPDVFAQTDAAVFCSFDFLLGNHSFLIQPGVVIRDKKIRPFFRKFRYSVFTETVFVSAGKDSYYFGEGIIKNWFFVSLPARTGREKTAEPAVWHTICEIPVQQFLFTGGFFFDADSPDMWTVPQWYSLWVKAVYSHPFVSVGFESDVLFQPELPAVRQKKAYTFKAAAEIAAVLPHHIKLYTNAQLPVDLLRRNISDWGVLTGISKNIVFPRIILSSIAEAAYSRKGLEYALFQSMGAADYVQLSAGIQGLEGKNLIGIVQSEFFISDFALKLSYITKNLLEKKTDADKRYIGIFSIAVRLGGGL